VGAETIDWKDIDGIGAPCFHTPCTPPGCIEILDRSGVELNGTNAVVVVRSNLVGLPVAMLLMHRDPINTVNIVHSKTTDAPTRMWYVVVAAVERAMHQGGCDCY
jgi:methylenetetrahydrofolate dehydrogenase (NADP+)/methenyltetrahydrofolate cyclohydrolase